MKKLDEFKTIALCLQLSSIIYFLPGFATALCSEFNPIRSVGTQKEPCVVLLSTFSSRTFLILTNPFAIVLIQGILKQTAMAASQIAASFVPEMRHAGVVTWPKHLPHTSTPVTRG